MNRNKLYSKVSFVSQNMNNLKKIYLKMISCIAKKIYLKNE